MSRHGTAAGAAARRGQAWRGLARRVGQALPAPLAAMARGGPALLAGLAAAWLLAACDIDFGGLFYSKSSPDERFAQSRRLGDPVWNRPAPPGGFSFVFITDPHVSSGDTSRLARLGPALSADSFVVAGGDITNNGQARDIIAWLAWTWTLPVPVFTAIGNHDLYFEGWDRLGPILGQSSYSLAVGGGFRLIVLDSGNATLGRAQFKWLQGVLARATEPVIAVVSHYPLFSTGFSEVNFSDIEESQALQQLFGRYGVKLVLSGHTHRAYSRTVGPTAYLVGEASRAGDSGQQAIRVRVDGGRVSWSSFPLP